MLEFLMVALVALVLFGRSDLLRSGFFRALRPWRNGARRGPAARPRGESARDDRLFWFLAIIAATAVAAWIVTRTMIVGASHATR